MKQHMTTVGGLDGSYDTWHAEERDDNETTTTTIFGRGSPPYTFAHGKHKPFGYPPSL